MTSSPPDLSRLSAMACRASPDVGPVILRVQSDLFAGARRRDDDAVRAFTDLALTLLPQVDDATAAHVARRLGPLAGAPVVVLAALVDRGGECARIVAELRPSLAASAGGESKPGEPVQRAQLAGRPDLSSRDVELLSGRGEPSTDLILAQNHAIVLQGRVLADLVDRGRSHAELARALLGRHDLSAADEACLYLHASPGRRAIIRARLAASPDLTSRPAPRPGPVDVAHLLAASDAQDVAVFGSRLAALLQLEAIPDWGFSAPERHDLLAFSLLAAGLSEEECVRVFLTLNPAIARSVAVVFGLVAILRETHRTVAAKLLSAVLRISLERRRPGRFLPSSAPGGVVSRAGIAAPAERTSRTGARFARLR